MIKKPKSFRCFVEKTNLCEDLDLDSAKEAAVEFARMHYMVSGTEVRVIEVNRNQLDAEVEYKFEVVPVYEDVIDPNGGAIQHYLAGYEAYWKEF